MPRLKQTESQKADVAVLAYLQKQCAFLGYDYTDLSEHLHISQSTYYSRKRKPSTFTLGELRALVQYLHLTDKEICEMIGVNYKGKNN